MVDDSDNVWSTWRIQKRKNGKKRCFATTTRVILPSQLRRSTLQTENMARRTREKLAPPIADNNPEHALMFKKEDLKHLTGG